MGQPDEDTGYGVVIDELRNYANNLSGKKDTAQEIADLVSQSDVGDESWGAVGLFVKQRYSELLADLHGLLADVQNGLESASGKFSSAAGAYQEAEDGHAKSMRDVLAKLEGLGDQPS